MNIDEIHKIIKAFEAGSIRELEIEKDGTRLRLIKPEQQGALGGAAMQNAAQAQQAAVTVSAASRPEGKSAVEDDGGRIYQQKSPIVGTFYRSPAPGGEAFVEVGDKVKKGQILCIVEAMKLMNEIEAEVSGEIVQVYVENARPVEYGETLFGVRTN